MAEKFKEQGGAATMDPSRLRRWVISKVMTKMSSKATQQKARKKAEVERQKAGAPHRVEYFHQIDDGYSHLAAQVLERFSERYQVELGCHLVTESLGDNLPEPDLLKKLARKDSHLVAPYYDLSFPEHEQALAEELANKAGCILASLSDEQFIQKAAQIGEAMWSSDADRLNQLSQELGAVESKAYDDALVEGNAKREELRHYSGGMFYYGGEWYWGVDRLYHLEERLAELGLDSKPTEPKIVPRPEIDTGPLKDDGSLTLEIYASLRSPYTAIAFDPTVEFAKKAGVKLILKPVLPMVMRGVPATKEKGEYIFFDTGREARAAGVPFGPCADPIGEPVRRAYSLYSWAESQGKGEEFFSAFLQTAWSDAINTNNDKGMQVAVEKAGLDWSEAKKIIGKPGWEQMVEDNRMEMYHMGLWGVPSYRLLDESGNSLIELWGQDRLWVIAKKIQSELQSRQG